GTCGDGEEAVIGVSCTCRSIYPHPHVGMTGSVPSHALTCRRRGCQWTASRGIHGKADPLDGRSGVRVVPDRVARMGREQGTGTGACASPGARAHAGAMG